MTLLKHKFNRIFLAICGMACLAANFADALTAVPVFRASRFDQAHFASFLNKLNEKLKERGFELVETKVDPGKFVVVLDYWGRPGGEFKRPEKLAATTPMLAAVVRPEISTVPFSCPWSRNAKGQPSWIEVIWNADSRRSEIRAVDLENFLRAITPDPTTTTTTTSTTTTTPVEPQANLPRVVDEKYLSQFSRMARGLLEADGYNVGPDWIGAEISQDEKNLMNYVFMIYINKYGLKKKASNSITK